VTGCKSKHKGFFKIEEARKFMEDNKVTKHKEVIKDMAVDTTPKEESEAYYAVANGLIPGIRAFW
jgi:viroplasmin and RNaseH domain-containing protein